jgi:hypothetical protein
MDHTQGLAASPEGHIHSTRRRRRFKLAGADWPQPPPWLRDGCGPADWWADRGQVRAPVVGRARADAHHAGETAEPPQI